MRAGVILFPGSNCAEDSHYVWSQVIGHPAEYIWHRETDLTAFDLLIVPGGFSYGDYLRTGALASISPVIRSLHRFAEAGGLVIGICNGFQILTETKLLPGTLLRNRTLRFISKPQYLRVENEQSAFTSEYAKGEVVTFPIAHNEGNYFASDETIAELEAAGQVVFRYSDAHGVVDEKSNPNGSINSIAGIINRRGNVLGMMPHPERAGEAVLGHADGLRLFKSILATLETAA
jgi:phosphoribosylformylglycinamidine synthase I